MNRDEVREMIADLRGGIPHQCDSCAGKFEQELRMRCNQRGDPTGPWRGRAADRCPLPVQCGSVAGQWRRGRRPAQARKVPLPASMHPGKVRRHL